MEKQEGVRQCSVKTLYIHKHIFSSHVVDVRCSLTTTPPSTFCIRSFATAVNPCNCATAIVVVSFDKCSICENEKKKEKCI